MARRHMSGKRRRKSPIVWPNLTIIRNIGSSVWHAASDDNVLVCTGRVSSNVNESYLVYLYEDNVTCKNCVRKLA